MTLVHMRRFSAPIAVVTLVTFMAPLLHTGRAGAQSDSAAPPVSEAPDIAPRSPEPSGVDSTVERAPGAGAKSGPTDIEQRPGAPIAEGKQSAGDPTRPGWLKRVEEPEPPGVIRADKTASLKPAPSAAAAARLSAEDAAGVSALALPSGADKTGVTGKAISVPNGSGTIDGMGESFSAQLSTGVATFSIPFRLPAGRGVSPSLGLSYSSGSGSGVAGMGWQLGVPFIARQTDRGTPKYLDQPNWHAEQDRFVFNGGQELVPICVVGPSLECPGKISGVSGTPDETLPNWAAGWQYFRARVEGAFLRFFWSPDHRTWRVQDKSGAAMELGVPLDGTGNAGALERNPDKPAEIYRWHLVRQYDAHGQTNVNGANPAPVNAVVYRYLQDGGMAYLSDIFATGPASQATSTDVATYAHHIKLTYELRTDPTSSYRAGWRIEQRQRLRRVDVASRAFSQATSDPRRLVRRYHLTYDPSAHISLLTSVQTEGRCGGGEGAATAESSAQVLPESTGCPRLPPLKLGYSHVAPFSGNGSGSGADLAGYEGFDERVQTLASSPPHSLDEELTTLLDVNSDALPDVLVTAPGVYGSGHGVFFNGAGGQVTFDTVTPMSIASVLNDASGTLTLRNLNVVPLDLDGDAIVNLLHMPQVKSYSVYTPEKVRGGWQWTGRAITTASQQSPKIDFGKDTRDIQIADVNFDGLVDVIVSTGTELQTFFALGRYPGGDGQFGQATRAGALSAQLSNDPVRTCLPWSGTPVRFSDRDTKLADMNGDGIVDIVRIHPGDVRYWPGRGNGVWGTGARDDCAASSFAGGRHLAMSSSPQYSDIDGNSLLLEDVNGDGLSDLVQVRYSDVDIWLNVDGTAWTERHIVRSTPASPSFANRVRLVDVNGSGTPDILWGNQSRYQYIDLQGGVHPWLLTSVDNGLGKTTQIDYTSSVAEMLAAEVEPITDDDRGPWQKRMPISVQVVKRVTDRDNLNAVGRAGGVYVTEYSYRDPVYEGRQREFRGFTKARVRKLGDANSPTDVTKSTFILGECVDLDPSADTDTCDAAHRYLDNGRDALKGLPVMSEQRQEGGLYLHTTHFTYTLRHLYTGLDGRAVRHAFQSRWDQHLYDVGNPIVVAENNTYNMVIVEGANEPGYDDTWINKNYNRVRFYAAKKLDSYGNELEDYPKRCLQRCGAAVDENIYTVTQWVRPTGDSSGWLWRPTRSWVVGVDHPGARNYTRFVYNSAGDLVDAYKTVTGSLALDRSNAAGVASAPAPADASSDREFLANHLDYDGAGLGNVIRESGPNGRCRDLGYESIYADLPTLETVYAGGAPPFAQGQCGPRALPTSAAYDRGFGKVTVVVDPNSVASLIGYDGFGRLTALAKPRADGLEPSLSAPSVKISYFLPDKTRRPYSLVHTRVEDSKRQGDGTFVESWSVLDGLGRTLLGLQEGELANTWIVSGFVEFDGKGAPARTYLPYLLTSPLSENEAAGTYSGDFPVASSPPPYQSQRYDAFGRPIRSTDFDGTVVLQTVYHDLFNDLYDAEDLGPGDHQGTFATERRDGYGRVTLVTERIRQGGILELRNTAMQYLPTGEPEIITRTRGSDQVVRWMRYDSLGRMVFNVEPNTSANFNPDPAAAAPSGTSYSATALKAWRYAYNDAGDLVGTSDARGCGVNYTYDAAGRILGEDYSPCEASHAAYSAVNAAAGTGFEVYYQYDNAAVPSGLVAPPVAGGGGDPGYSTAFAIGRLVSVSDRAASRWSQYDGRGREIMNVVRVAQPNPPANGFTNRYAPRWYYQRTDFDAADREIYATTGAKVPELAGTQVPEIGTDPYNRSVVSTTYTPRGTVKDVTGSFGNLVTSITRTPDGLISQIKFGDAASTTTDYSFDQRRRVQSVQTYRGPPVSWSSPPPNYLPAPNPSATPPTTFQLLLQDEDIVYDAVSNPVEIRDWRVPEEWPAGAKPVTRKIKYDDLYRATQIDYQHSSGADDWISPYYPENAGISDDPRRAQPSPHVSFPKRVLRQTFQYDWLGNTLRTDDDAGGFYDRSLGPITNGTPTAGPYQLKSATNASVAGAASTGQLNTVYDAAGDLTRLDVARGGACLPTGSQCSQRFDYEWDEVGRLTRARRWDVPSSQLTTASAALPTAAAQADLRYAYDASDDRVVKTATDGGGAQRHTLYIFDSLELRRTIYQSVAGNPADYDRTPWTEVPYLSAHGERLARVVYDNSGVPSIGAATHVLFELGDHLGSTSMVLDQATGELVERSNFQAYGGADSDYRPARWKGFREDYRFTGKEEDVEVGLQYFGKRYLNPLLARWVSADPLTVQTSSGDLNVYAYVSGQALHSVDAMGLEGQAATPVPFGPKDAAPGTKFVFGGGPDRLVPLNEFLEAAKGKQVFVYDPRADLPANVDVKSLSAEAYTQAVRNILSTALGGCTGPACGSANKGEETLKGPTDSSDALALAGGLTEGQGPVEGGKAKGSPGGACASCEGSDAQQAALGATRISAAIAPGAAAGLAGKVARFTGIAKKAKWATALMGEDGPGLRDHFVKHGEQVGARTAREFDQSARLAIQNGRRFKYRDRYTNEPRVGYWDSARGLFTATSQTRKTPAILTHFPETWKNLRKLPGFAVF